jgi:hypothetical protein
MEGITYIHGFNFGKGPEIGLADKHPVLLSSEAAAGYPYPITPVFSPSRLVSNILLFGATKLLLVTREVHQWALSLYFQTLNEGATWSIQEFIERNGTSLLTWSQAETALQPILERLGVKPLLIGHDKLRSDTDKVIRRICNFCEVPEVKVGPARSNESRYGSMTISAYRKLNGLASFPVMKQIVRTKVITPRKLIQSGRFGALTERLSRSRLTAAKIEAMFP